MKLAPYLLLALVIVLGAVFFLSYPKTQGTVKAPLTLPALEHAERVEVIRPDGATRAIVVFEKSDGVWWLTRPIEAQVSRAAEVELNGLFARPIATDDLDLDPKKRDDYGLDDASAVQVSIYEKGREQAALALRVGHEVQVPRTGVRRTYIQKEDDPRVYRAQIGLGHFFRAPLSELRTRQVVGLDASSIRALNIQASPAAEQAADPAPEAERYRLKLIHMDYAWALAEPQLGQGGEDGQDAPALDLERVDALVRTVAELRADGFAEDKTPEQVGLEPAAFSIIIETPVGTHVLRLGDAAPGQKVYARFDDGPIFTLNQSTGALLRPSAASLLKSPAQPELPEAAKAGEIGEH